MSIPIIPLIPGRYRLARLGRPVRQAFILASLVLFVLAAAFPAERPKPAKSTPCHPLVSKDPLHLSPRKASRL